MRDKEDIQDGTLAKIEEIVRLYTNRLEAEVRASCPCQLACRRPDLHSRPLASCTVGVSPTVACSGGLTWQMGLSCDLQETEVDTGKTETKDMLLPGKLRPRSVPTAQSNTSGKGEAGEGDRQPCLASYTK